MKNSFIGVRKQLDRGSVSVEMAIFLPILLLFLAVPLFFAQVFWYYTVAQKAAHDAARFLATATRTEMTTQATGGGDAPVAILARSIADAEIAEIRPTFDAWAIAVQCDLTQCGMGVPQTVRVQVRIQITDKILGAFTDEFTNGERINLTADATMSYAGK
jgi:Flp pilus assembly protein TadG